MKIKTLKKFRKRFELKDEGLFDKKENKYCVAGVDVCKVGVKKYEQLVITHQLFYITPLRLFQAHLLKRKLLYYFPWAI